MRLRRRRGAPMVVGGAARVSTYSGVRRAALAGVAQASHCLLRELVEDARAPGDWKGSPPSIGPGLARSLAVLRIAARCEGRTTPLNTNDCALTTAVLERFHLRRVEDVVSSGAKQG